MPDPKKFDLDFRPGSGFSTNNLGDLPKPYQTAFLGGIFLPPLRTNEIEIARITLESTTFDVISVRARIENEKIFYSVVDEYEGQIEYKCQPESTGQPLTMGELIELMENTDVNFDYTGLVLGMARHNFEESGFADQWVHFATVSSDIYPQLGEWYFDALEEWCDRTRIKAAGGEIGGAS